MIINSFGGGVADEMGAFNLAPNMVIWNNGIQSGLTAGRSVYLFHTYIGTTYSADYQKYIGIGWYGNAYGWLLIARNLLNFRPVFGKTITGDLYTNGNVSKDILVSFYIVSSRNGPHGATNVWEHYNTTGSNTMVGYYQDYGGANGYLSTPNVLEYGEIFKASSATAGKIGTVSFTIPSSTSFGYLAVGTPNSQQTVWLGMNNIRISA